MALFETAQFVEAYRQRCEDRIEVFADALRTVIVVADGAGGSGDGLLAAESVIRETKASYATIHTPDEWSRFLMGLDLRISSGETTAVIVDLRADRVIGASVGDSAAWMIDGGEITNLTRRQIRKPLLGSQAAKPISFEHGSLNGVLLAGSDGFFHYVKPERLTPLLAQANFFAIPRTCIDLVRLPSGELWDDTAVVVCRVRPAPRSRKRYSI